jgi:hypothetical protein
VFLAGPTPRRPETRSWRPEAIERVREQWRGEGRLVVFAPERRDGHYDDYTGQVDWEERSLHLADEVIFYVPREPATMSSSAATPDGFVHELPGGSGPGEPLGQAISELDEETGLVLETGRLRAHGARQAAATLSAHRVHLFSAEITAAELDQLRAAGPHGVEADGERTHVEIRTYGEIRAGGLVDWATFGMLAETLGGVRPPPGSPPVRADAGERSS